MITPNTLYYTFSTIPQILGALVALLAAFVHFRITRLEEYLVGDGKAVSNRLGEKGYILTEMYEKRLKDAIERKNIYEIKAILAMLSNIERDEGHTKTARPRGLQVIFEDRFCGTQRQIEKLKSLTLITAAIALFTIATSLFSLALVDTILKNNSCSILGLIVNIFFAVITLVLSFLVIYQGLTRKTPHETGIGTL
jgi:hypothetical protein